MFSSFRDKEWYYGQNMTTQHRPEVDPLNGVPQSLREELPRASGLVEQSPNLSNALQEIGARALQQSGLEITDPATYKAFMDGVLVGIEALLLCTNFEQVINRTDSETTNENT